MTKKSTPLNSLTEDIQFVEHFKNESLTALSIYNHLCQLYLEEGDEGFNHLEKMWRVARADMQKSMKMEQ